MKGRRCLQAVLTIALAVAPVGVMGQFQAPTDEELKMTSEPKAPGAAAIYLLREEKVDENLHFHSFHARIKVLSEKGKELATVSVPYFKRKFTVTDVKARTIHADGTVVPLDVKPQDLLAVSNSALGVQVNKMVFTLPSVEVGSILEYRWELRYDDESLVPPDWEVQQPYFVRKAHYSFLPVRRMIYITNSKGQATNEMLISVMLPPGVEVKSQAAGGYVLDMTDIDPIPDEEYTPPMNAYLEHAEFYYSAYRSKDEFWKGEGASWSKEMDHFANESKGLKEAVSGIVAPGDSEDAKARKIYAAVMKLDNTDFTRRKGQAELKQLHLKATKQAEDVWKQKSGSSDELALLYLAMVRIAGLKAYAFGVADRNERIFNPFYLSLGQLDDLLVIVTIDGKDKLLDPGEKLVPFGQLHWKHTSTGGLRQTEHGPSFGETTGNPFKEATTLRDADLKVAADGTVTGTVRITMGGPEALRWRQLSIRDDEDEVRKQFTEELRAVVPAGVQVEFDHFLGLDDNTTVLMASAKVSGNLGTATGKRMFLPGAFFASHAHTPFAGADARKSPVDMHYADQVTDQVRYRLPEGFQVECLPAAQSVPWAGHAVLVEKAAVDKGNATMVRQLARAFTLLDPKEYGALHDFYQKVASADQQQLVLTVAPAAKAGAVGN